MLILWSAQRGCNTFLRRASASTIIGIALFVSAVLEFEVLGSRCSPLWGWKHPEAQARAQGHRSRRSIRGWRFRRPPSGRREWCAAGAVRNDDRSGLRTRADSGIGSPEGLPFGAWVLGAAEV